MYSTACTHCVCLGWILILFFTRFKLSIGLKMQWLNKCHHDDWRGENQIMSLFNLLFETLR